VAKKSVAKKPVAKKPVSSKSGSSKPASSKPASSKLISVKPTLSKPVSGKSVSSKSVSGKRSSEKTVPINPNPIAAHMNLTVLEVADPSDLNVLMADPRIGVLIAARLSDSSAIITPDKTEALLKALKDAGHTPKIVRPEFRGAA
jgi:hypothetical protein